MSESRKNGGLGESHKRHVENLKAEIKSDVAWLVLT